MASCTPFGFYPHPFDQQVNELTISTLKTIDDDRAEVEDDEHADAKWIYSPLQRFNDMTSGTVREKPYPARVFGLPKTHQIISVKEPDESRIEFIVWCFGLFTGMRMTTTEAGYLDATPIVPGKLCDFRMNTDGMARALLYSDAFWEAYQRDPRIAKAVVGAIHCLFLSQNPLALCYEQFIHLYTAMEGCFYVLKETTGLKASVPHTKRIAHVCNHYGIPTPAWANIVGKDTELSVVRNETIHEALFFNEPLGFRVYQSGGVQGRGSENRLLEMQHLVCRFIVAILGIQDQAYLKSSIDDRQVKSLTP